MQISYVQAAAQASLASSSLWLSILLLLAFSVILRYGFFSSSSQTHHLPPGSFGLPLLGETLQFALFNSCPIGTPPPFLSTRLRRYGSVFKTHLLGRPMIVSMDAELNKLLLLNEGRLVHAEFPRSVKKIIGPSLTWRGPSHKWMREIATSLLSPATIRQRYLNELQDHALWVLNSWSQNMHVDAQADAKRFIFTFVIKHITGLEPEDPLAIQLKNDLQFLMAGYSSVPIEFPGTKFSRVMKARGRIISFLEGLVRAKKNERRAVHGGDLLDYILLSDPDQAGWPYTERDIVEVAFLMMTGAVETASILLTNIIKYLSENPKHLNELRAEHTRIRMTKAANEKLTWGDYKQMHFTEKVIQETLRLGTIAHYLTREALQDIDFGGFTIPKGWMIFLNFSMPHLDPKSYPQPLEFNPWRWEETSNNAPAFMPFSGGARSCVGSSFTKFEVSMFLHYLVTLYRWERVDVHGQLDQVSGLTFPTMRKGLHIQVQPL